MKWKELSIKDRKQIYDNIKSANPNATYFDIKEQFDSVPAYEDGGKKLPENIKLPPQYTPGTPEYFQRQQQISGKADVVQPEAYVTPAGYVKDAVNFVEDLAKGNYSGAAVDALLNVIPWGVGKGLKKMKSRVSKANGLTQELDSYAEHFAQTRTGKKYRKQKLNKPTEEEEISETVRLARNRSKYDSEISRSIEDAIFPDKDTYQLLKEVDATYGTDYQTAYTNIAMRDMTNRGKYLSWGVNKKDSYGTTTLKADADRNTSRLIQDYRMTLNPDTYMPGTANHELGHIADGLAGSRQYQYDILDEETIYTSNKYLDYLANINDAMGEGQLRKLGLHGAANSRKYLLNPTEAKSHMLTLKRSLKDSGDIVNWSSPVTEDMLFKYFDKPGSNKMIRNQYDLYRDKQGYIDRLNKLIPMEILMPLGGAGLTGYELNKE